MRELLMSLSPKEYAEKKNKAMRLLDEKVDHTIMNEYSWNASEDVMFIKYDDDHQQECMAKINIRKERVRIYKEEGGR